MGEIKVQMATAVLRSSTNCLEPFSYCVNTRVCDIYSLYMLSKCHLSDISHTFSTYSLHQLATGEFVSGMCLSERKVKELRHPTRESVTYHVYGTLHAVKVPSVHGRYRLFSTGSAMKTNSQSPTRIEG